MSSIYENIFPLQPDNVAYPQSAEAGEQISLFYGFILHRSSNQCPNLLNGHIRPFTLRQTYLIRVINLRKGIHLYNLCSHGSVQSSVQYAIVGMKRKVRHPLPFGAILCQQVVDIRLAERLVDLVQCHAFSGKIFQNTNRYPDLVSVLFTSFRLILLVGFHPIQKKDLFPAFDSGFSVGHLDNALRLDGIGGSHCRFVLPTGIIIGFGNKVHLQILIRPFAIPVYIQIQAFISVCQFFHPQTDRFFDFCRLLYSWHTPSSFTRYFCCKGTQNNPKRGTNKKQKCTEKEPNICKYGEQVKM